MRRAALWTLVVVGSLGAKCVEAPLPAPTGPILCELRAEPHGPRLFEVWCASCHDGTTALRPEGLYGQWLAQTKGPRRFVDAAFIRESVLDPIAHVTSGHAPVMPTFKGQLKQAHLDALVEHYRAVR